jgi:hypothetical protein
MNADNLSESESAFTSELDDLTIVHIQSDLTTSYDSHRTEEGFLVDPDMTTIRVVHNPDCNRTTAIQVDRWIVWIMVSYSPWVRGL